jgi:hypothetical protein
MPNKVERHSYYASTQLNKRQVLPALPCKKYITDMGVKQQPNGIQVFCISMMMMMMIMMMMLYCTLLYLMSLIT